MSTAPASATATESASTTGGKKAGGSIWIYTILIVVGIVFAVGIVVALVIAIRKRPKKFYVSNQKEPEKEVFVVLFDQNFVSGHTNSGKDFNPTNGNDSDNRPVVPVSGAPLTITSSSPSPSTLKLLINNGSATYPLDGIASQIGSGGTSLTIATKQQCQDAANKGASFKYLVDETTTTDAPGNYKDVPFLIQESFDSSSSPTNYFYNINSSNKKVEASTDASFTRLSIAFYGVKPTIGDFVTRQGLANNPRPNYGDTTNTIKYRPSCTFKASWLTNPNSPVITIYYRIVPFNSTEFNTFVSNNNNYLSTNVDGRIKYWSANYS